MTFTCPWCLYAESDMYSLYTHDLKGDWLSVMWNNCYCICSGDYKPTRRYVVLMCIERAKFVFQALNQKYQLPVYQSIWEPVHKYLRKMIMPCWEPENFPSCGHLQMYRLQTLSYPFCGSSADQPPDDAVIYQKSTVEPLSCWWIFISLPTQSPTRTVSCVFSHHSICKKYSIQWYIQLHFSVVVHAFCSRLL